MHVVMFLSVDTSVPNIQESCKLEELEKKRRQLINMFEIVRLWASRTAPLNRPHWNFGWTTAALLNKAVDLLILSPFFGVLGVLL